MEAQPHKNIVFSIFEQIEKNPIKVVFDYIDTPESPVPLTYAELLGRIDLIGTYLENAGAKLGDRILISLNHPLDYLCCFYGCVNKGLIAVPVSPISQENHWNRIFYVIKDCKPHLILADTKTFELLENLLKKTEIKDILLINVDLWDFSHTESRIIENNIKTYPIAFLQYTSGSTGNPKGVMVSHQNLLANFQMMQEGMKMGESSRGVSWLPLFHDMGLIGAALLYVYLNATLYLMSPLKFLRHPFAWLEALSHYKGTHSPAPNFAYEVLAAKASAYDKILDLSHWEMALSGAEPIRFNTIQRFTKAFAKHGFRPGTFYPAYGMAESTLYVTGSEIGAPLSYEKVDISQLQQGNTILPLLADDAAKSLISCGKPKTGAEVFIINPSTLEVCPTRCVGEIWVKGLHVCEGYYNKPELSHQTFCAYTKDKKIGPCLRTGDLGYLNEGGELFVTGRIKELIIIKGKNLFPHDIEETVQKSSEHIRPNSVIAFSLDDGDNEKLIIVVELRANLDKIALDKLALHIKKTILQEHGVVTSDVIFGKKGSITRTTSGKLQRQLCKKKFLEKTLLFVDNLEMECTV